MADSDVYQSGKYGKAYRISFDAKEAEDTAKQLEDKDPRLSLAYKQFAKQIKRRSSGGGSSSNIEPNMSLAEGGEAYATPPTNQSTIRPNMSTEQGDAYASAPKVSTPKFRNQPSMFTGGTGAITAAPKTNAVSRFIGDFSTGFNNPSVLQEARGSRASVSQMIQGAGALTGIIGGTALIGTAGGRQIIAKTAKTGAVLFGAQKATSSVLAKTGGADVYAMSKNPIYKDIVRQAKADENAANKQLGLVRRTLTEAPFYRPNKDVFAQSVRTQAKQQGLDQELAVRTATRLRKGTTAVETAGILYVSTQSELFGRAGVVKNLGSKTFKTTSEKALEKQAVAKSIGAIGKAGAYEGASLRINEAIADQEKIKPSSVASYGVAGAASAATIGGAIIYTSQTRKAASKFIQTSAYVGDPAEYAGDKLADLSQYTYRKITNKLPNVPVMTFDGKTFSMTTLSNTQKTSKRSPTMIVAQGRGTKTPVRVYTSYSTNIVPSSTVKTNADVPSRSNINTIMDAPIKTDSNIPSIIKTNTNINTIIPTNTNVNTNIPTVINTNIPVRSQINTLVQVPTFTPQGFIPAYLPKPRSGAPPKYNFGFTTRKRRPNRYASSLVAGIYGIKKGKKTGLTGLEVRPL